MSQKTYSITQLWTYSLVFLISIFLVTPILSQESARKKICRDCFTANYRDVEINEWLKTMASLIGKNILIDESIKGKITIVSNEEIPISRALDFMKQVLEVKNLDMIEEPYLIKVVPSRKKLESAIPSLSSKKISGIVTKILQIPDVLNLNEVVTLLKSLAGENVTVISYKPTNSIIVTGYSVKIERIIKIFSRLVTELRRQRAKNNNLKDSDEVHIYRVRYVEANSLAQILGKLSLPSFRKQANTPNSNPAATPKIEAVSHKESNSVVVTANSEDWSKILPIIQKLDSERLQILIEVLIAEISSSNVNDFGIDWRTQDSRGGQAQFNSGIASTGNIVDSSGQITGNNTLSGFSLGFIQSGGNLLGVLQANITRENFKVLSSPQILALDNEQSELTVGQDIPVRTQERTSGGGTSETTVNSFEYRNAGITLRVTPHINPARQISLQLFGEITGVVENINVATNPVFTKRNINTNVLINDKQTIVLGGLISSQESKRVQKVPGLGDIPLLGFLFRRTSKNVRRTNLMIFITPYILDSLDTTNRITEERRQRQIRAVKDIEKYINLWPEKSSE